MTSPSAAGDEPAPQADGEEETPVGRVLHRRPGQLDVQQSIRFYDLLENLNKGRLMLAFLAEYSRGKSELINALFFSSFKERLLPSDVGRTTSANNRALSGLGGDDGKDCWFIWLSTRNGPSIIACEHGRSSG